MKKGIKFNNCFLVIVCVFVLMISITSCQSIERYEENLGPLFYIKYLDESGIEAYSSRYQCPFDAYGVESGFMARRNGNELLVLECDSESSAKELAKDLGYAFYADKYNGYNLRIEFVRDGKFVLIGDKAILDIALGTEVKD